MTTGIWMVHRRNDPWSADGGYEYNLVLIAPVLARVDDSPGRWCLDGALGSRSRVDRRPGPPEELNGVD